jgi:hypothetical protein
MKKHLLLITLIAACATRTENVGDTVGSPSNGGGDPPSENHAVRWAVSIPTDPDHFAQYSARGVAFDPKGDVVAIVATQGATLDENGERVYDGSGPLITKRARSDGSELWTRRLVGTTSEGWGDLTALAIDPEGAVIVAGTYGGIAQVGSMTLDSGSQVADLFVAKYTSVGDLVWVRSLGVGGEVSGVAVDSKGTVFLSGTFANGSFAFLGQTYVAANDLETFVLAYSGDGAPRWARVTQAPGDQHFVAVAVTPEDHVVVAGSFDSPASFGGPVLTPPARGSGILAAFTSDGSALWSTIVGSTSPSSYTDVDSFATTASGRLLVESVDFADYSQNAAPTPTVVRAFDSAGQLIWTQSVPTAEKYRGGRTIGALADDRATSTRWVEDDYNAEHPEQATGSLELVRVGPDGEVEAIEHAGQRVMGAPPGLQTRSTANGPNGETVVGGQFGGRIDFGVTTVTGGNVGPMPPGSLNYTDALIFVVEP